jgi:tetratricopeptide (TPR) repeat protein
MAVRPRLADKKRSKGERAAGKASPPSASAWRIAGAGALLAAIVVVIYANSVHNGFVWDDHEQIVMNPALRPGAPILPIFTSDIRFSHLGLSAQTHTYRPLQMLTYRLLANAFGMDPAAFHLCSLLLAIAGVLAAFAVFHLLTDNLFLSFAAAALFAVDPVHTEAVDWIAASPDLGCALFLLLAFAFFLLAQNKSIRPPRSLLLYRGLSVAAFAAALLWKETAAVFPLLVASWILIAHQEQRRRAFPALRASAPYWITLAVYVVLRVDALGSLGAGGRSWRLSPAQFALTDAHLFLRYWAKLALPIRLDAYSSFVPVLSWLDLRALAAIAFVLVVIAGVALLVRRAPLCGFAALWVCLTLLPVMDLNALGRNALTERYLYIPSAGFCLLVVLGIAYVSGLLRPRHRRILAVSLLVAAISALGTETIVRNSVWKDDRTLFAETLRSSPDAPFVLNRVADAQSNDPSESVSAEQNYRQAIALAKAERLPDRLDLLNAYNGLGLLYAARNDYPDALRELHQAQDLAPNNFETTNAMGMILLRSGQWQKAEPLLENALIAEPANENVLSSLAILEWQYAHNLSRAADLLTRALSIHSEEDDFSASLHNNLGGVEADRSDFPAAIRQFRMASRIAPDNPEYHTNLANALAAAGQWPEARSEAELALQIAPGYPAAEQTLDHLNHLAK